MARESIMDSLALVVSASSDVEAAATDIAAAAEPAKQRVHVAGQGRREGLPPPRGDERRHPASRDVLGQRRWRRRSTAHVLLVRDHARRRPSHGRVASERRHAEGH